MAGCMKRTSGFLTKSANLMALLLFFFCLPQISRQATGSKLQVIHVREDGQESAYTGSNRFCYINSIVPGWKQTWTRIQVRVWSSKQLEVTVAADEERLQELDQFSFWGLVKTFIQEQSNETTVPVGLFSQKTCFKIHPADANTLYTVKPIRKFDVYLFMVFLAGVLLFCFAESMSRSQVFYYTAGMSTGLIASLIILIFVMARLMPKKSPFYVLIVGGWSFSVYIIQLVFMNLQNILKDHWHLALGYTGVVGFVSFAVCYRHGPLVEERSINILSWTLQLFGLLLIYAGVQVQQVAFAIILAALCTKNLQYPFSLAYSAWRLHRRGGIRQLSPWPPGGGEEHQHPLLDAAAVRPAADLRRSPGSAGGVRHHPRRPLHHEPALPVLPGVHQFFTCLIFESGAYSLASSAWRKIKPSLGFKPEPRRLLSEEEYQKQGEEETRRALEDLRKYCSSPDFSPWRTVSRLESPKRFADFVEGSPHLMSNEASVHAQEYGFGGAFFEDELFSTDEDEDEEGAIKPFSYMMQGD